VNEKVRRVSRVLHDLAQATSRVSADYSEMAQVRGEEEFDVHVRMVGLDPPDSRRLFAAIEKRTHVETPVRRDPALTAEHAATLDVRVVGVRTIAAAGTVVLDVLRADLLEVGLAAQITSLTITVVPTNDKTGVAP